jgi:hypothetical protein
VKVNLKDISAQLVKRGRDAYDNPELVEELLALDATVEGDAFIFPDAKGDTTSTDYTNHKNLWRNRVTGLAERYNIGKVSIAWSVEGDMVVSIAQ